MPVFRITLQKNVSPRARNRAGRSTAFNELETVDITSTTLTNALLKLGNQLSREARQPRIVAAEELLALDVTDLSDDRILAALAAASDPIDVDEYDGVEIYMESDFEWLCYRVTEALSEAAIAPGLSLSVLAGQDGSWDYTMIDVHDQATGTYRSVGRDAKALIGDRSLTGQEAFLSVTREILSIAATHYLF